MNWLWLLAGLAAFLGIGYGAYRLVSWQSLGELAVVVFKALMPSILKAVAPKDLTAEQKAKIRRGEDPFDKRPSGGHGKGG